MNDKDIIKALECCTGNGGCKECQRYTHSASCVAILMKDALDFINRQNAEIDHLRDITKKAKAEAIMDFAEKLKRHYVGYDRYDDIYAHHIIDDIDFLVEEMLGCNPNADHPFGYKNISELKNKCGTCVYGIPSTFGKGFCYVECTNQEHIAKYCKRPISRIRQRTAPACRSYEDKTEKGGDNDA